MGQQPHRRTRLARLRRDVAGNTLAMMAISLIPVSALAGSAVDIARLYVIKARLQQACDAGVLAGRKFMTDSAATTLDANAALRARQFFDNNFPKTGWMRTADIQFTPAKTANNRVAGTAQVNVPMTVMKMFAAPDVTLATTCEARFDVADTDVMFVLDTTGSMACLPEDDDATCSTYAGDAKKISYARPTDSSMSVLPGYAGTTGWRVEEKTGSRISALRTAVIDFWQTMKDNIQPTTQVRYSFAPYTSTVNAGGAIKAMSPAWLVGGSGNETANYQTRHVTGEYEISRTEETIKFDSSGPGKGGPKGNDEESCKALVGSRDPESARTFKTDGTATLVFYEWKKSGPGGNKCQKVTAAMGPSWTYENWPVQVAGYVAGGTIKDPSKVNNADTVWLGCVEETDSSTTGSKTFDVAALPPNLNPDLRPSGADRWRPMWPDVTYQRIASAWWGRYYTRDAITGDGDDDYNKPNMNTTARQQSGNVSCGKPIQRLSVLTKAQVESYVKAEDFAPLGGTYHDTGMLWGLRLLSRSGIFSADNQPQNGRGFPKRVLVFFTDGQMSPSATLYGLYGMETWDQRVANGDTGDLKDYHNKRFLALCNKADEMGIDVWTVAISATASPTLTSCASSPEQALHTTSGTGLSDAFRKIAQAVARLRLSQ